MRKSLALHYHRIEQLNADSLPQKGPLIIATNHPNTFLDAIVIAAYIHRPLHFLSKGEAHSKVWIDVLLKSFNLIPIYKISKKVDLYNKNQNAFKKCYEIFDKGGAILIFPEGRSIPEKKIQSFKKSLAHIALGYIDKQDSNTKLPLLPIGINYSQVNTFNSDIQLSFGAPILVNPWGNDYVKNQNQTFAEFNQVLSEKLRSHVIEIDQEDEQLFDYLCHTFIKGPNTFYKKFQLSLKLNELKTEHAEPYHKLDNLFRKVKRTTSAYQLNYKGFGNKIDFKEILLNLLLLPFSLLGLIFCTWPYVLAKMISKRAAKQYPEYTLALRFAITTFTAFLYVIFATLFLSIYVNWWMLLIPFVFFISLISFKKLAVFSNELLLQWRVKKLKVHKIEFKQLMKAIEGIDFLAKEFLFVTRT